MSPSLTEDWITAGDGLRLHVSRWTPEDRAPRAAAIVVHGLTEHAGRYEELAAGLCRLGCGVYCMELRGHGRSEGSRIFMRWFDEHLDDMDLLFQLVRGEQPERPLVLFGHSMGGAISALFCITRQPPLAGLILSAPALTIGSGIYPWLRPLAGLFGRLFPRLRVVKMGAKMLSRDPAVVEQFKGDPLVFHGRLPCRTASELLRIGPAILGQASRIRVPLLAIHGTGDRLTDISGSRALCEAASTDDTTLCPLPDLWHDLLHEPEKEEVLRAVVAWVAQRIGAAD